MQVWVKEISLENSYHSRNSEMLFQDRYLGGTCNIWAMQCVFWFKVSRKISRKRVEVEKLFTQMLQGQAAGCVEKGVVVAQWIVMGRKIVSRVACGMQSDLWQLLAILFICQINH